MYSVYQKNILFSLINASSSLFSKNFQAFRFAAPAASVASELCFHVCKSSQCGYFKTRLVSVFFLFFLSQL